MAPRERRPTRRLSRRSIHERERARAEQRGAEEGSLGAHDQVAEAAQEGDESQLMDGEAEGGEEFDADTNPRQPAARAAAAADLGSDATVRDPVDDVDTSPHIDARVLTDGGHDDGGRGPDDDAEDDAVTNPHIDLDDLRNTDGTPKPSVVVARAHIITDHSELDARRSEAKERHAPPPPPPPAPKEDKEDGADTATDEGRSSSYESLTGSDAPPSEGPATVDLDVEDVEEALEVTEDVDEAEEVAEDEIESEETTPVPPERGPTPPPPPTQAKARKPPPPPRESMEGKREQLKQVRKWWERFFSEDYLASVLPPDEAQVAKQVDFLEHSLGLTRGATVLDVGCGLGTHALELARRGYLVVGLDLSMAMITRAAEAAQHHNLKINFVHTDIREIEFEGAFDAVICMGTTFGFFDDEANRDVLARLYQALKPGGRILTDVVNRDHVIQIQPNLVWFQGEGCVCMEESEFNFFNSRLTVRRTMMRDDGQQSEAEYSIRLYALHELGQLMQSMGFRVLDVSGQEATPGTFFGIQSPRILVLAERRALAKPKAKPAPKTKGKRGASTAPPRPSKVSDG